jgi:hypothetical protein
MYVKYDTTTFNLEITVNEKNIINGHTTTFFRSGNYAKTKILGNYNKKKDLYEFSETEVVQKKADDMILVFIKYSLHFVDSKKNELTGTAECINKSKDPTENCYELFTVELIRYEKPK